MGMSRSDNYYDTVKGDLSAWTIICSKRNWFKFKRKFSVQLTHRGKTWIGQQKYTQVNTWWGIKLFIKLFLFQKKSHVHVPFINDRSQIISPMFLWIIHLFFLYKKGLSFSKIWILNLCFTTSQQISILLFISYLQVIMHKFLFLFEIYGVFLSLPQTKIDLPSHKSNMVQVCAISLLWKQFQFLHNCRFPWFMGESEMPFHGYYHLYSSNNLSPHMQSFALKLQAPAEEMHVFVISFPTLPFITCCKLGEPSSEIIGFK